MPPRRYVTLLSIVGHAVVIAALVVAQLLAVGPLPAVHRPLTFENVTLIEIKDIDLPAPPRTSAPDAAPGSAVSKNAAPVTAPVGVLPETGNEQATETAARRDAAAVEGGGGIDPLLHGSGQPPPPPPPAPEPVAPVRLHSGMQTPRKIVDVMPVYPPVARSARVEGVVILEAVIDAAGRVETVRVLRSIPLLDQAAVDAVKQWRFTPTLLNGLPVPIVMTVTVNFKIEE